MGKVSAYSSLATVASGVEFYAIDTSGDSRKVRAEQIKAYVSTAVTAGNSGYVLQSTGSVAAWKSPIRYVGIQAIPSTVACSAMTTGVSLAEIHIPPDLNGYNLSYVHGMHNSSAKSAGRTEFSIHNITDNSSMLSSWCEIDSGLKTTDGSASQALIDTAKDDVVTNDVIGVYTRVKTTDSSPLGLYVTLGFSLP